MNKKDVILISLLGVTIILPIILSYLIPIGGGGIGLVLVLTVPVTCLSALIMTIIYWLSIKNLHSNKIKNVLFTVFAILPLAFFLLTYPYK